MRINKVKGSSNKRAGITTDKEARKFKAVKRISVMLKILIIVTALIYPVFMNILGGIGMYMGGGKSYGIGMLISSGLIILSVLLCFKRINIPSAIIATTGIILCIVCVYSFAQIPIEKGLSDADFVPLENKYYFRHYPTLLVYIFQIILTSMQLFSYDEIIKRKQKHNAKLEKENEEAPKIISEDVD
jgi:uncharacterized membrane protein